MNITYRLNGKKLIKNIDIRMYFNKFDISCSTNLVVLSDDWENEQSKSDTELNENLLNLKLSVLKQYNLCFAKGVVINANWLKNVVKTTFDRPNKEVGLINQDYTIYFSDFASYWIDCHSKDWKTSARKNMSTVLVSQYASFVSIFKDYEKTINCKLELRLLTQEQIYLFIEYLQGLDYSVSTIDRLIGRLRFFCNRAKDLKLDVCNDHSLNFFLEPEDEIDGVYLDESEINKIINYDFSFDENLNIAKQNYLILLFTGLRGTDGLKNLDISNIKDDIIKIKTQKTGQTVVIPVHKVVKDILKSNFGNLPPKITLTKFNLAIKTICQICDIDEQVFGSLHDKEKNRKVKGYYKKFQLISSHSARRSFLTIHYGKISNDIIQSVLGWSTDKMIAIYNKTTKNDYANQLNAYWQK
jgi:integrase